MGLALKPALSDVCMATPFFMVRWNLVSHAQWDKVGTALASSLVANHG